MTRETKLLVLVATLAASMASAPAEASVSVALSLDEVAQRADVVARVVPEEQASAWQGGTIVTTTRVRVDQIVAGALRTSVVRVRTMGGVVDGVGQTVSGEARFAIGTPSIVFLSASSGKDFLVAGRAQGQLLLARDGAGREIVRLGETGALVEKPFRVPLAAPKPGLMVTRLDGGMADEAARAIVLAWERTHAR